MITENRPLSGLVDDEAFWFPAQMTAGDSFLRVTRPDGGSDGDDDGIGLPGRGPTRGGGGGRKPPKKGGLKPSTWLWITLWGVAAVSIVGIAARKEIAAEITQGWLHGQGVTAKVKFDKLSLSDVSGTILIGDAAHPDVSVEHFDANYSLNLFAAHGQPLFRLNSLHAVHPLVAMVLKDGQLHFGSLDKLVQSVLNAPANGAAAPHLIQLDDAILLLQTDYGLVRATGGVTVTDGQVSALNVSLPASHFSGPSGDGQISEGHITAKAIAGQQLEIHGAATVASANVRMADFAVAADAQAIQARNINLSLDARLPYRAGASGLTAFNGAVQGSLAARADDIHDRTAQASGLEANLTLAGELKSATDSLQYEGATRLLARADSLQSGNSSAKDVRFDAPALAVTGRYGKTGASLAVNGGLTADLGALRQDKLSLKAGHLSLTSLVANIDTDGSHADFTGKLTAGAASGADLSLTSTSMVFTGNARSDQDGVKLDVTSDLRSDGRYDGLKALAASRRDDPATPKDDGVIALDRAFQRFGLRVQGLKTSLMMQGSAAPQFDVRLRGAAQADLNGGGHVILTPQAQKPLLASGETGGFAIVVDGPGLPKVNLTVADFGVADRRNFALLAGRYTLSTQLSAAPAGGVKVDAHGRFATTAGNGFMATLDAPATVTAASAELGDHIETISATVSQADGALIRVTPAGWHISGLYSGLALTAPNEGVKLADGQGGFDVFSQGASDVLGLKLSMTGATISDAMPADQRRFNPLHLDGTLTQDTRAMTGRFTAGTPAVKGKDGKALPIGTITLNNDPLSGKGSLAVATVGLVFDPSGLQPAQLSPMLQAVMTRDVTGTATFNGAFEWTNATTASHGVLKVDGMDFRGAMGAAQGLRGEIDFTSLAPLRTDPGQTFHLDHLAAAVPLDDFNISTQFLGDHIAVERADVMTPGGKVVLDPTDVPLDGKSPISGALAFNGLDFGKVVAATDLKQNMVFEGHLSGRVPFTIIGGHVTFAQGAVAADGPGTISIKRQAVTGVSASGTVSGGTGAAGTASSDFNPFQDLAFQAMEHVSYDQLDAKINSLPDGRIDVNFHIKGRFAPPQQQKATISLSDYLSGKWMQKPIKLPSNTPVELYLDMPVNLDGLFTDLGNSELLTPAK